MRKPHNDRLTPTDIANPQRAAEPSRGAPRGKHVPERKCVLTGAHDARGNLIRLALAPDGAVLPDVRAKAPGRGAWIGVTRAELETAIAKGKLKGALSRAFKTDAVTISDSLADDIAVQLERATLERLGLEARASNLLTGAEKVDGACRSGQVALLLHAADASADGRRKRDQSWRVGREEEGSGLEGTILPVDRGPLSMALGRENAVHVAITDHGAAARVRSFLDRWIYYLGQEPVRTQADAAASDAGLAIDDDDDAPAGAGMK